MKNIIIAFAMIAIAMPIFGQQSPDTLTLSRSQAIEIGLSNRFDVKSSLVGEKIAENNIKTTKNNWIPTITASGDVRYNTQLQETILPEAISGGEPIELGTANNTVLSIDLDQPLYRPTQKTAMKIAEKEVEIQQVNTKQTELDAKYEISEAYYEAVMRQETWTLAKDYTKRSKDLLQVMNDKLALNSAIENDVLRQKLDFQNAVMKERQAKNDYKLAMKRFKNTIQYDDNRPLVLTQDLKAAQKTIVAAPTLDADNNLELRSLMLSNENTSLQLKQASDNRKPTVSLYGNYTYQFQDNSFDYTNNVWSAANYVGVKMSIPITNSLTYGTQKQGYQLELEQNTLNYQFAKENAKFAINEAYSNLMNKNEQLDYAKENYELAQKIYQLDIAQYNLGVLEYRDVLDSIQTLNDAEQNLVQSIYDFQQGQLSLEKAEGK